MAGIAKDSTLTSGSARFVQRPDPVVVFDDTDFSTGPRGWRGLINGTAAQGVLVPSTMPGNGASSLHLGIEDGGASYNADGYAMAVKRASLPFNPATGNLYEFMTLEMEVALGSYWNTQNRWASPRCVDIGIDNGYGLYQGGQIDNRALPAVRYLVIDESNSSALVQKFQTRHGDNGGNVTGNLTSGSAVVGGYSSGDIGKVGATVTGSGIPAGTTILTRTNNTITLSAPATATLNGAALVIGSVIVLVDLVDMYGAPITYPYGYNEDKTGVWKIKIMQSIVDQRVVGLQVQGKGYGFLNQALADPYSDLSLYNLGKGWAHPLNQGGVASFYGGANACVELYGRNNTGQVQADLWFSRPRMEMLAA
ncbi:MAG: hypothetical protein J0I33_07830 [Microbacterium ginsengisoli]|jgi:hypothetical protein|uniref:hypothetical protein n=1 Tax=Microbacterium TaxID=33882 RepID=UPI0006FB73D1|nr:MULTISPECIES: hypothetical protein [unclassified Microbacterium]KQR97706.1 hypothetical protein ASF93_13335 [Microbacterium sp. Leaf347]KQS01730.1 hypothetical protein ASG00_09860 [Microbacterium sp. Leaf351]MBN9198533.1 hypothetical protein [Microbacterium ginsengisoli]OJU78083.1 MAG: hypothetical protein BGO15_02465 [Microbacterium sp. 71-23]